METPLDDEGQTSSPKSDYVLLPETFRGFEEDDDEIMFYTGEEAPLKPGMKLGSALVQTMRENVARRTKGMHVTPPSSQYEVLAVGKAKAASDGSFEAAVKLKNLESGGEEVWKLDSTIWERFVETR